MGKHDDCVHVRRFVIELANYAIQQDKECVLMRPKIREARKEHIESVVSLYKRGRISTMEAVKCISNN